MKYLIKYLKLIALLVILGILTVVAIAAIQTSMSFYASQSAFGIEKGAGAGEKGKVKREEIEKKWIKLGRGMYTISNKSLGYPNKDFSRYIIYLSESTGVCQVMGISDFYYSKAEMDYYFEKAEKKLMKKYSQFVSTGKDVVLKTNNNMSIILARIEDAIMLTYRFDNYETCKKELLDKEL